MNKWFGKLKTRFTVTPLSEVATLGTGHTPSRDKPEYWVDCNIPWVTVEDIRKHGQYNLQPLNQTVQHISQLGLENSAAVLHPAGTVMLSRTASIGLSCITGKDMATTQAFVTWTANPNVLEPRYLHATLKVMEEQYAYLAYGATHLTIYFPDIKTIRIPLPKLDEQILIADFLDQETSKIDALISQQEKLIELTKEKRHAIVSNAVRKGVALNAEMTTSGDDWLGEIPTHWESKKLKWCVKLIAQKTSQRTNLIALENIESWSGSYVETDLEYEGEGVAFEPNDILFGKLRPYLAKVLLAKKAGQAVGDLYVLRPREFLLPEFVHSVLLTQEFIDLVSGSSYGSKMPRASWDFIGNITIAYPPIEEQSQLVNYIRDQTMRADQLIQKADETIKLLYERRKTLISSAVMGLTDSRELSASMEAA
jgi:type I restriction enzyme, S subunit